MSTHTLRLSWVLRSTVWEPRLRILADEHNNTLTENVTHVTRELTHSVISIQTHALTHSTLYVAEMTDYVEKGEGRRAEVLKKCVGVHYCG